STSGKKELTSTTNMKHSFKIQKLSKSSPSNLISGAIDLLYLQMKSIGDKKSRTHIKTALEITLNSRKTHTLIAVQDKKIVGICFFNVCVGIQSGGKYLWINEIFVLENYRNSGIAKSLLESLEKYSLKNKSLYILAQRDPDNLLS